MNKILDLKMSVSELTSKLSIVKKHNEKLVLEYANSANKEKSETSGKNNLIDDDDELLGDDEIDDDASDEHLLKTSGARQRDKGIKKSTT